MYLYTCIDAPGVAAAGELADVLPVVHAQDVRQLGWLHVLLEGDPPPANRLRFGVQGSGCRVQGLGFRVQGSGCRVQGSGFRVEGSGLRVQDAGFRVRGAGFRVQGAGCRDQSSGLRDQS